MQRFRTVFAIALLFVAFQCGAMAQDTEAGPQPAAGDAAVAADPVPPRRAIDAADLSAYVDGLVEAGMEREGIAGVTVAIVDREGPLLLRGYGIASQSPRREVDPDGTLFRIASISKTFTYLLALQLVDAGKLDLDAPVNDYLPPELRLPDDGYAPVLVRHLFTHTAGFEDSAMGHLFVDSPERVSTLAENLQRHRPQRVREPGTRAVYSNYSVALLGALVAHLTGTDFESLAERELFAPMGMAHSTFREPMPEGDPRDAGPAFRGQWSDGFKRGGGGFKTQVFEHIAHNAPGGGASSTAADMGRYMRMLLNGGEHDGVRVLSPSAWARLQGEPLFRNDEAVGGFAYGFFDNSVGEVRTLGHGGATQWFHSGMTLAPEPGVGIFVSTNTDTGRRFAAQLARQVLERYFEDARAPLPPEVPADFDPERFVGKYNSERTNFSLAEKALTSTTVTVSAADDRSLVIAAGGESKRWVPDGPLTFREAEGSGRMAFFEDGKGRIAGFAPASGHNVFARVGPQDVLDNLLKLLSLAGAVAVLVLAGAWLRRNRRSREQAGARFSALWLYFTALCWIVLLAMIVAYFSRAGSNEAAVFYGYPGPLLTAALWTAVPVIAFSAICVLLLWPAWRANDWGFWRKLRHTLAVAVFALAAWMLWHWNLVGWKL